MSIGIGEAIGGIAQGAGGMAQGAGAVLSKLGDVLISPVNMMCNWAEEPLRRAEYKRQEESKDKDVQRTIESQVGVEKALSNQRMQEDEFSANMKIKSETEIVRVIAEIEELRKDKAFERMKAASDAVMEYQKELARINIEVVDAIASMNIELQRKVADLVHKKTQQYKEMQYKAFQQAKEQSMEINSIDLPDEYKSMLMSGVHEIYISTIKEATRFIQQLNDDMQLMNKDISLITSSGQRFIERHLEKFQLIGFSEQTTALLSQDDSTNK